MYNHKTKIIFDPYSLFAGHSILGPDTNPKSKIDMLNGNQLLFETVGYLKIVLGLLTASTMLLCYGIQPQVPTTRAESNVTAIVE